MLHDIFHLPNDLETKMSLLALQDSSLDVSSAIVRKYQGAQFSELWKHLLEIIFNGTHVQTQNT